jgi:hypothetical protein
VIGIKHCVLDERGEWHVPERKQYAVWQRGYLVSLERLLLLLERYNNDGSKRIEY